MLGVRHMENWDFGSPKQMSIHGSKLHQTESSHVNPGAFINTTDTFELTKQALECFKTKTP